MNAAAGGHDVNNHQYDPSQRDADKRRDYVRDKKLWDDEDESTLQDRPRDERFDHNNRQQRDSRDGQLPEEHWHAGVR
jgi:hypothetical protein